MVRAVLASLSIHAAVVLALLGTAWGVSIVRTRDEEPPVVLMADFEHPAPARTATRSDAAANAGSSEPAASTGTTGDGHEARALSDRLRALEAGSGAAPELDALARRFGATVQPNDEAPIGRPAVRFAGLVAGNATSVAYVVDASGSMVGTFPTIVDEVERSIMRLEPTQRFTVVCFRKDGAVALGGDGALRPASRAEREGAVRWLRERVTPAGRSSPIEALATALRSGADCVFLLSSTVTGPASHELDRESTLALVDRLNPRDRATGARRTTIQCIQFLEPDPGGTLEAIAAEHFGAGGFRFIPRSATGLDRIGAGNGGNSP